jgi:hypothetical protein
MVSILAPAAAAGAAVAVWRLVPEASWLRRAVALPALTAGYVVGHLAAAGAPSLPPVDTTQSLFYLALLAGALGLVEVSGAGAAVRRAAQVLAVGSMLGLVLHPLVRYQWSTGQTAVRSAALAVAALALGWATRALAARLTAVATLAGWIAVFAGTATLLVLARTALLAQLASAVAIALLVLVVVVALAPTRAGGAAVAAAALPFVVPMLIAFVLNGFLYAELDAPAAAALAASPLAAAAALAVARQRGPRAEVAAALLAVAVLLAPFVASAAISYAADDRGYGDYGE